MSPLTRRMLEPTSIRIGPRTCGENTVMICGLMVSSQEPSSVSNEHGPGPKDIRDLDARTDENAGRVEERGSPHQGCRCGRHSHLHTWVRAPRVSAGSS